MILSWLACGQWRKVQHASAQGRFSLESKDRFHGLQRRGRYQEAQWLLWYDDRQGTSQEPGGGPEQSGVTFHEGEELGFAWTLATTWRKDPCPYIVRR